MNSKNVSQLPPWNQSTFQTFHLSRKVYLNQLLNQTQHRFCWNVLYLPHVPGLLVGSPIRIMLIYFKCRCILLSCYFLTMSLFCLFYTLFFTLLFFYQEVIPFVVLLSIHPFPPKINILWKIKMSYLHQSIVQKDKFD